jgi:hypothetical protein
MSTRRKAARAAFILAAVISTQGCAALSDMASALTNLQRLKFKIGGVREFRLLGLDLSAKSKLGDLSAADLLNVARSYAAGKLPVSFVLDVLAVNPNTGSGGTTRTVSTLTSLECRLLIDGQPTVVADIDHPVEIPGTGQESIIPMRLSLDLFEFFANKRYEDLVGLALAIGGQGGSPARLGLDARPTVSTPLGPIAYPGRMTIVSTEFR